MRAWLFYTQKNQPSKIRNLFTLPKAIYTTTLLHHLKKHLLMIFLWPKMPVGDPPHGTILVKDDGAQVVHLEDLSHQVNPPKSNHFRLVTLSKAFQVACDSTNFQAPSLAQPFAQAHPPAPAQPRAKAKAPKAPKASRPHPGLLRPAALLGQLDPEVAKTGVSYGTRKDRASKKKGQVEPEKNITCCRKVNIKLSHHDFEPFTIVGLNHQRHLSICPASAPASTSSNLQELKHQNLIGLKKFHGLLKYEAIISLRKQAENHFESSWGCLKLELMSLGTWVLQGFSNKLVPPTGRSFKESPSLAEPSRALRKLGRANPRHKKSSKSQRFRPKNFILLEKNPVVAKWYIQKTNSSRTSQPNHPSSTLPQAASTTPLRSFARRLRGSWVKKWLPPSKRRESKSLRHLNWWKCYRLSMLFYESLMLFFNVFLMFCDLSTISLRSSAHLGDP